MPQIDPPSLSDRLNWLQCNNVNYGKHSELLDPVHAIHFALADPYEGMTFLKLWNEGRWAEIDRDWPDWKTFKY